MSDYSDLKRLAKAATPGPYRQCGADKESKHCACGQILSTATDELVAFVHDGDEMIGAPAAGQPANAQFFAAANPAAVLALIDENERLKDEVDEDSGLCDRLSALLRSAAVEVRGPEAPLKRHGFHDLPSRVKAVVLERDQLKAENEALRKDSERRVPLYEEINKAAGELPHGWKIRLVVELGSGCVELFDAEGCEVENFPTNNERLDYTVCDALEYAISQGEQA